MRVLICGGRNFNDMDGFDRCMDQLSFKPLIVIEGGAKGADTLARRWAAKNGVHCATVPALWDKYGRQAGILRNTAMLLLSPEYCIAMPGGNGTRNMVAQCRDLGIPVWKPYG